MTQTTHTTAELKAWDRAFSARFPNFTSDASYQMSVDKEYAAWVHAEVAKQPIEIFRVDNSLRTVRTTIQMSQLKAHVETGWLF